MAKTVREQIAAQQAIITKAQEAVTLLTAKLDSEVDPAALVEGANVVFDYGKGDTKRSLTGTITGVKPADPAVAKSATLIRVAVGTGFDAQIVTIYPANVTKVVTVAQVEAAADQVAA